MKMFRRLAAFAVALAMVLVMLPATLSVSAGELPEDVKGTKYEAAASLLCALDIMVGDGANFNPDNNVTRAEFAKILIASMGQLDAANAFAPSGMFDDVATGEWYAPFVEYAAQFGAINGYGDGRFGPNDSVTGYQAIKMIVFASGHNACIEDPIGGFPHEYANVAKEYGFTKNLSDVVLSEPMTRGQVAILTANVMKADMLKLKGASSESGNAYEALVGKSLLTEKHDVYRFDGLVTATAKTGIYGPSNLFADEVQIESGANVLVLKIGESGIENELGTYVRAYYRVNEDDGVRVVVSYDTTSAKNSKISMDYDDVDIVASTNSVVRYWKDSDKDSNSVKINIDPTCSIIWNGSTSSHPTVMDALGAASGKNATVEFMDFNGDNKMDVLNIKAYDTYVIGRIDTIISTITDKLNTSKKLKIDEEDDELFITMKDNVGDEYSFSDIAVGDVLSVAKSDDGQIMDILVSLDIIEGSVSSVGKRDGRMFFEIDGQDYYMTNDYFNYVTDGDPSCAVGDLKVKIGKNYEFKLDAFGEIAYSDVVVGDDSGMFGFIIKTGVTEGADASVVAEIYSDGYIDRYSFADSIKLDGDRYKGSQIVTAVNDVSSVIKTYIPGSNITGKTGYYGDGAWYGIPVLFELDDDGNISYIDTPVVGTDEDRYTLQPVKNELAGRILNKKYSSSAFGNSLPVATSTNVIRLPKGTNHLTDESKWSTSKTFSGGDSYYVQLFTTDPDSYAASYIVVANGANGSVQTTFTADYVAGMNDPTSRNGGNGAGVKTTPLFVVSEVYRAAVGEDGEETIIISGLQSGSEVEYTVDPEYYETGLMMDTLAAECSTTLDPSRTKEQPFFEGDVLRLARNAETDYVTFAGPVFYIKEKCFASVTAAAAIDSTSEYAYYVDIATVSEMDDTNAVLSYLLYNTDGEHYKGAIAMEGDRIGTNQDVTMTETGYEGAFTKMFNMGNFSKIMKYEANKAPGRRVDNGSLSDIITLEDASNLLNPSIVIMHHRYGGSTYSMIIINL